MWQALLVNVQGAILDNNNSGQKVPLILHEFPIQKVPATISNHDPEPLALILKRENSHNLFIISDNCLHYSLILFIRYCIRIS